MKTNEKNYTDAALGHEVERQKLENKANINKVLIVVTLAVACLVDIMIYKPIVDNMHFDDSAAGNFVLCLLFAALPIALAALLAYLWPKVITKYSRKASNVIFFVGVLAITVIYLTITCQMRGASGEDTTFVWMLNALAIGVTVATFVVHAYLHHNLNKFIAFASKEECQRNICEAIGVMSGFKQRALNANGRRTSDHNDYCDGYENLCEWVLDGMDESRRVNASLFAENQREVMEAAAYPYKIAGVPYANRNDAKAALLAAYGAPGRAAANHRYGPPPSRQLDEKATKETEIAENKYRAIIAAHPTVA